VHGLTTSDPVLCRRVTEENSNALMPARSRSSSADTQFSAPTPDYRDTPRARSSYDLMTAARALLMKYLRRCYPEIPYEYRRRLILGAVARAQKAAHSHYAFEHNSHSTEEERRKLAANWASQLSFWNMGIGESARHPGLKISRAIRQMTSSSLRG